MKRSIYTIMMLVLFALPAREIYSQQNKEVQSVVDRAIETFNRQDFPGYFASFVNDHTTFPYVVSPLRHDASAWKAFIEGTAELEHVSYHQQDNVIQTYNGNTAVVSGYYTFKWKEKGGEQHTQSGRASMTLVRQGGKWLIAHMHFSKMF